MEELQDLYKKYLKKYNIKWEVSNDYRTTKRNDRLSNTRGK